MLVRKNNVVRMCLLLVAALFLVTGLSLSTSHAKTKTYNGKNYGIVKVGNSLYCTASGKIFTVNAKTGGKRAIYSRKNSVSIEALYVKGKYLYFTRMYQTKNNQNTKMGIYRMNRKTKKVRKLATGLYFVIKGKHIYYNPKYASNQVRRMTLSGRHNVKVKGHLNPIYKRCNKKGFSYKEYETEEPLIYDRYIHGKAFGYVYLGEASYEG